MSQIPWFDLIVAESYQYAVNELKSREGAQRTGTNRWVINGRPFMVVAWADIDRGLRGHRIKEVEFLGRIPEHIRAWVNQYVERSHARFGR